jgi:hypothetical protein
VHDLRRGAAEPVALGADRLIEGIAAFQLSGAGVARRRDRIYQWNCRVG